MSRENQRSPSSQGIMVFVMTSGMVTDLARVARETDEATRKARARLVAAVREASAASQSQAEIARKIGRSQPEVSRLLHFHGTAPLARRLRTHRQPGRADDRVSFLHGC